MPIRSSAIDVLIAIKIIIIAVRLGAISLMMIMARLITIINLIIMARLIGGLRMVNMRCPSTTGPGVVFVRTLGATPEPDFGGLMIVKLSQSVRIQVSMVGRW